MDSGSRSWRQGDDAQWRRRATRRETTKRPMSFRIQLPQSAAKLTSPIPILSKNLLSNPRKSSTKSKTPKASSAQSRLDNARLSQSQSSQSQQTPDAGDFGDYDPITPPSHTTLAGLSSVKGSKVRSNAKSNQKNPPPSKTKLNTSTKTKASKTTSSSKTKSSSKKEKKGTPAAMPSTSNRKQSASKSPTSTSTRIRPSLKAALKAKAGKTPTTTTKRAASTTKAKTPQSTAKSATKPQTKSKTNTNTKANTNTNTKPKTKAKAKATSTSSSKKKQTTLTPTNKRSAVDDEELPASGLSKRPLPKRSVSGKKRAAGTIGTDNTGSPKKTPTTNKQHNKQHNKRRRVDDDHEAEDDDEDYYDSEEEDKIKRTVKIRPIGESSRRPQSLTDIDVALDILERCVREYMTKISGKETRRLLVDLYHECETVGRERIEMLEEQKLVQHALRTAESDKRRLRKELLEIHRLRSDTRTRLKSAERSHRVEEGRRKDLDDAHAFLCDIDALCVSSQTSQTSKGKASAATTPPVSLATARSQLSGMVSSICSVTSSLPALRSTNNELEKLATQLPMG